MSTGEPLMQPLDRSVAARLEHRRSLTFALVAGPLAWFIQLCLGYMMSSWPCFPVDEHYLNPLPGYHWTWTVIVLTSLVAAVIALVAAIAALGVYRRASVAEREPAGRERLLAERSCFLAIWGVVFSAGALLTIVGNTAAYVFLPRCAG
jgi:hypothetical protein